MSFAYAAELRPCSWKKNVDNPMPTRLAHTHTPLVLER